jgi:hypothetical protein
MMLEAIVILGAIGGLLIVMNWIMPLSAVFPRRRPPIDIHSRREIAQMVAMRDPPGPAAPVPSR